MPTKPAAVALLLLWLAPPAPAAPGITELRLANGLVAVVEPGQASDLAALDLVIQVPASLEDPGQTGIRLLIQQVIEEQLSTSLAAVGGEVETKVTADQVEFSVTVLSSQYRLALMRLAEAIANPSLSPEKVDPVRQGLVSSAKALAQDPFQLGDLVLRQALYGEDHPYARPPVEPELERVSAGQAAAFYRRCYLPGRAVLAVAGRVDPQAAARQIEERFGEWAAGPLPALPEAEAPALADSKLVVKERKIPAAYLLMAFPAPGAGHPDYPVVQLINTLLGGAGRIRAEPALQDLGMVFQVSSSYPALREGSYLAIQALANPLAVEAVKSAIVKQVNRLQEKPATEEELARARRLLVGNLMMSQQGTGQRAHYLAWARQLGIDWREGLVSQVERVTPAQVQEAARKYFQHYVLALIVPSSEE